MLEGCAKMKKDIIRSQAVATCAQTWGCYISEAGFLLAESQHIGAFFHLSVDLRAIDLHVAFEPESVRVTVSTLP